MAAVSLSGARKAALVADRGFRCERCGREGIAGNGDGFSLYVHHKRRRYYGTNADSNLLVLCVECHDAEHLLESRIGWDYCSILDVIAQHEGMDASDVLKGLIREKAASLELGIEECHWPRRVADEIKERRNDQERTLKRRIEELEEEIGALRKVVSQIGSMAALTLK